RTRRSYPRTPRARPAGLHLALVDDVLTTGTTAHALARLLKRAGAARVDVYCLARTPKPGSVP
ncbi:ComF family protein, partial [Metapseudomonas otitidis]|uniref:ComF family protein n=1 Tax=Metapseudomonas otitidis TaxID=319939 RepID=UPI002811A071